MPYVIWTPVRSQKELALWDPDQVGFWGGGRFHNPPLGVVVTLVDSLKGPFPGHAEGFHAEINHQVIIDSCGNVNKPVPLGIATTIAHEVLLHCIGETTGHYESIGCIDASDGKQIGTTLSDKAAHNLIDQLDAEEGD